MDRPARFERRVGERVSVSDSGRLTLHTPTGGFLGRRRTKRLPVQIVDMSVSGLAVIVPKARGLAPNAALLLEIDGWTATVLLRRAVPLADGRQKLGLQLVKADDGFQKYLDDLGASDRPEDLQQVWERST